MSLGFGFPYSHSKNTVGSTKSLLPYFLSCYNKNVFSFHLIGDKYTGTIVQRKNAGRNARDADAVYKCVSTAVHKNTPYYSLRGYFCYSISY